MSSYGLGRCVSCVHVCVLAQAPAVLCVGMSCRATTPPTQTLRALVVKSNACTLLNPPSLHPPTHPNTVRERAKQLVELLGDDERIREERDKARRLRDKFVGIGAHGGVTRVGGALQGGGGDASSRYGRYTRHRVSHRVAPPLLILTHPSTTTYRRLLGPGLPPGPHQRHFGRGHRGALQRQLPPERAGGL